MKALVQIISALLGSAGFALVFNTKKSSIIYGAVGGMLGWSVFLLAQMFFERTFFICLCAAFFIALYSEICAHILKAPSTVFFIPSVVPLIPGSTLYYTIEYLVKSDWKTAGSYAFTTAEYASAIAIGGSFVWALQIIIKRIIKKIRSKNVTV